MPLSQRLSGIFICHSKPSKISEEIQWCIVAISIMTAIKKPPLRWFFKEKSALAFSPFHRSEEVFIGFGHCQFIN